MLVRPSTPPGESGPAHRPGDAASLVGADVGDLRVVRVLGQGGMGVVYLAQHRAIGSRVALKCLHPHLAAVPALVERFLQEARAVSRIGHPNIVRVLDFGEVAPGQPCLVMEYLQGRSLGDLLERPLAPRAALPILRQVCDALEAAHAHGVVHRDLKPDNIFLTSEGRAHDVVKLLDFGVARVRDGDRRHPQTAHGVLLGTPEYMAPEQVQGGPVDARTDVYALGMVAWQLTTGRPPFGGLDLAGVLSAQERTLPPPPHEVVPGVPTAWSLAILGAVQKRPEARYPTARDFAAALEAALTPAPAPVPRGPAMWPEAAPAPEPEAVRPRWTRLPLLVLDAHGLALPGEDAVVLPGSLPVAGRGDREDAGPGAGAWPAGALELVVRWPGTAPEAGARVQVLPLRGAGAARAGVVLGPETAPPGPGYRVRLDDAAAAEDPALPEALLSLCPPAGDAYVSLQLPRSATCAQLRARLEALIAELDALAPRARHPRQRAEVDALRARLGDLGDLLTAPARRAAFDAALGNHEGVARCLEAGLAPEALEDARRNFLRDAPHAEAASRIQVLAARAHARAGAWGAALSCVEQALRVDPLHLDAHRLWAQWRAQAP